MTGAKAMAQRAVLEMREVDALLQRQARWNRWYASKVPSMVTYACGNGACVMTVWS